MEVTLEKLQELVIGQDEMQEIMQTQEDMFDYAASVELTARIAEAQPIQTVTEEKANMLERVSYLTRNAYIFGYMSAVEELNEVTKMFIADLQSNANR